MVLKHSSNLPMQQVYSKCIREIFLENGIRDNGKYPPTVDGRMRGFLSHYGRIDERLA